MELKYHSGSRLPSKCDSEVQKKTGIDNHKF